MKEPRLIFIISGALLFFIDGCSASTVRPESKEAKNADSMIKAGEGVLAPVYAPLAEQISREYQLSDKSGIGIDIGSGPGTLIIELCKRTRLHWINADINPYFFAYFLSLANKNGFSGRVSAVYADAKELPFRDNYADVVVSRGSYHFWDDKDKAFSEIYRVLKPGGVAFIGRGFADDFSVEAARKIRARQKGIRYNPQEKAAELCKIMKEAAISKYNVRVPKENNKAGINYGVWVEFRK